MVVIKFYGLIYSKRFMPNKIETITFKKIFKRYQKQNYSTFTRKKPKYMMNGKVYFLTSLGKITPTHNDKL